MNAINIVTNVGKFDVNKVKFKWNIGNICAEAQLHQSFESPVFYDSWSLRFVPRAAIAGHFQNIDTTTSSLLLFNKRDYKVEATWKVNLIINSEEIILCVTPEKNTFDKSSSSQNCIIHDLSELVSPVKLTTALTQSLIFECEVSTFNTECFSVSWKEELLVTRAIITNYEEFVDNSELSDVTFIIEGQRIPAHKTILSMRSPVFSAMFRSDMIEKNQNEVNVEDVSANVFIEFLRFLYTARVNNLAQIAVDLFILADRYLCEDLKKQCMRVFKETLCVDNGVLSSVIH